MKKYILIFFLSVLMNKYSIGQTLIPDSCFTTCTPSTNFISSADLMNSYNADLMSWNGTNWIGSHFNANITTPPPSQQLNCRAIFIGNGIQWTTGGEAFGIRLSQPLITGQSYSFPFTYISHGFGSDGHFSPRIYSNTTGQLGGVFIDSLVPAGYNWIASNISFTANSNQSGHTWLIVRTDSFSSSGIISSFCKECSFITGINFPDKTNLTSAVFPNPFSNELNIKLSGNDPSEIILYDMFSREIWQETFVQSVSLNTELLAKGVYFYTIQNKNGIVKNGKVIKQ